MNSSGGIDKVCPGCLAGQMSTNFSMHSEEIHIEKLKTKIHQILINLCTNAIHSMEKRQGVLTVQVHSVILEGEDLAAMPGSHPGPFVELMVKDTGCGMDDETQKNFHIMPNNGQVAEDKLSFDASPSGSKIKTIYSSHIIEHIQSIIPNQICKCDINAIFAIKANKV